MTKEAAPRSAVMDDKARRSEYHFILPGVPRAPVGGFKVAYDYANALVDLGRPVTLWHSTAYFRETSSPLRLQPVRAWAHWALSRKSHPLVDWYPIDERVRTRVTPGYARPRLGERDVVVATAVQTIPHAARWARRRSATSVALIQHYEDWSASAAYIARAWASSDARVVIAPWLAEKCASLGLDSYTLPNAVAGSEFPIGSDLSERAPSVLSQLSSHAFKRPDLLREVFEGLHDRRPDLLLTAFGQDPRPADLPGFVTYVQDPSHRQLVDLYQRARVYVCVSDAEGWHLPPAEATLAGAAVVSTDIGGVRVSMGDDALFAPVGDGSAIVSRVLMSLSDPTQSQELVHLARARLLSRTIESNAEELEAVANAAREVAS